VYLKTYSSLQPLQFVTISMMNQIIKNVFIKVTQCTVNKLEFVPTTTDKVK